MVNDLQVRKLRGLDRQGVTKEQAAVRAGLDPKTARKYRQLGRLPSEVRLMDRDWRTKPDLFAAVWPQLADLLELNPGLEAKTLFVDLQRRYPGQFADGQLRTLQRRVKQWRALYGHGETSGAGAGTSRTRDQGAGHRAEAAEAIPHSARLAQQAAPDLRAARDSDCRVSIIRKEKQDILPGPEIPHA